MSEATKRIEDQADLLVEVKAVEKLVVEKFDDLNETAKTLKGQVEELGTAKAEDLAKFDKLTEDYNGLYDRLQALEQKGATLQFGTNDPVTLGQKFVEYDGFKSMQEGRSQSARMELKTAIINATGQNQPLVEADRLPGIAITPNRILRIRDVLPSSTTDSNLVEFTRESGFTNNAGPQIAGSPEAYENVTKPESGITFSLVTAPVVTLAHFIPASRQVLDDSAGLVSHIDNRLMYGLKLKEETQFLSGTGSNHQINGLITQATTYAPGSSPNVTLAVDKIRDASRQLELSEYTADFIVMHPTDWFNIEIAKVGTADDRYVVGNPNNMTTRNLWGIPIVVTNSITAGTFLIGSSMAAEIKDRQQAAVEMSREDSTNFRDNMVTILAEERVTLCVYRTEAFVTGSF